MSSTKSYAGVFLVFAVLALGLAALMHLDLRPRSVFPFLNPTASPELEKFRQGEPIEFRFRAPGAGLNGFHFPNLISKPRRTVELRVENLTRNRVITEQLLNWENPQPEFESANDAGDEIRVELRWKPDAAPQLPESFVIETEAGEETLDFPFSKLERGEPATYEFDAPSRGIVKFQMENPVRDPATQVHIKINNLTTGETIKSFTAVHGEPTERVFKPKNQSQDRIQIWMKWQKVTAPFLLGNGEAPRDEVEIQGDIPAFRASYDSWSRWMHLLWIPAGLLAIGAFRKSGLCSSALVAGGLAALATSVLSWQQAYSILDNYIDPDRFGEYGVMLADWVRDPDSRALSELFWSGWRYSWLPLTPILTGAGELLGLPTLLSAVLVSTLASFGAVLLFHRLLRRSFGLSEISAFAGTLLFLSHHFFLKSFAKPSTDPVGLLLIFASLTLIVDRFRRAPSRAQTIWLIIVVFLHFFARPPGFVFAAFTVGCAILSDWFRLKKIDLPGSCRTGLLAGILPLALVAGCFQAFGWWNNFDVALHSSKEFHHASTWAALGEMMLSMLQLLPIFWLFAGRDRLRKPDSWLLIAWAGFYLVLIVAIKAGFITRLLLPMLMTPVLFAALGLDRLKLAGRVAVILIAALNVGIVIYHSLLPTPPPDWLARLIYH